MKKKIKTFFVALFALFPSLSHAADFSEMPPWNPSEQYRRGKVVKFQHDIYISVNSSKGQSPDAHPDHWRRIDYNDRRQARIKTLYPIGAVVSHNGKHYISLRVNATGTKLRLDDSRRWMEFTHPGLIYDIPDEPVDPDQLATLIGVDSNNNGIRDDYEREILFSDLPAPVKEAALSAGKVYGALMMTAFEEVEVDEAEAREIIRNLVIARECRRSLAQLHDGAIWEETAYFNTFDRIEAKFVLQNMLADILQGNFEYPRVEHCIALSAI